MPTPRAAAIARAANVQTAMDNLDNSADDDDAVFGEVSHTLPNQGNVCMHSRPVARERVWRTGRDSVRENKSR